MVIVELYAVFYLMKYIDEPLRIKRIPIALSQRGIRKEKVEFLGIIK